LQKWFNWLQEASEESSDGETEKRNTTKRKNLNQTKTVTNVEEINAELQTSLTIK
jgi:hypothetical protein